MKKYKLKNTETGETVSMTLKEIIEEINRERIKTTNKGFKND